MQVTVSSCLHTCEFGEVVAHSAFSRTTLLLSIGDLSAQAALLCYCCCQSTACLRDAVGGGVAAGVPATQAICPYAK